MKRNIRTAAALIAMALSAWTLSACGSAENRNTKTAESTQQKDAINVVCTIFPQYDFVNQILGDNPAGVDVTYLLGSGVDIHNYQASAEDMIKIRTSDLFLYVGGESDAWVDAVVQQTAGENLRALALVDMVDVKEEEIVEGMEHDHEDEEYDHREDEQDQEDAYTREETHTHTSEYDEHVWLSLKNAVVIVGTISDELCSLDSANAEYYEANAAAYVSKLEALDARYEEIMKAGVRDTILVADRFPFRYLADDYHLTYYAAFPGCSAETEASFETVVFLAGKVGELKLPSVFIIDGSAGKIAQTVIANSTEKDAEIKTLNSIQSVSNDDIKSGVTYLGIMEDNLNLLKEALN